jgi:hypothetical protein
MVMVRDLRTRAGANNIPSCLANLAAAELARAAQQRKCCKAAGAIF